jgi:hypothetical protein
MTTRCSLVLAAILLMVPGLADAQDPKFEFAKPEPPKPEAAPDGVEWKASAQAGLILTTGNSRTLTLSGSAQASRNDGDNKLTLDVAGAFARSSTLVGVDADGNGTLEADELDRASTTTAKGWSLKLRYDRFFGERNSVYAAATLAADEPAGKELVGGGQLGYSRVLVKQAGHELIGELGYDFSYENPVVGDGLAIHSARAFAGYTGKLADTTSLGASLEGLFNLNRQDGPTGEVGVFGDTRLIGKLSLTTQLVKAISLRFGFTAKYDQAPAPRAPLAIPYAAGFVPVADKVDTTTDLTLIVNFL